MFPPAETRTHLLKRRLLASVDERAQKGQTQDMSVDCKRVADGTDTRPALLGLWSEL